MLDSSIVILLSFFLGAVFLAVFFLAFRIDGFFWILLKSVFCFCKFWLNFFSETKIFLWMKLVVGKFNDFVFDRVDSSKYTNIVLWSWLVFAPLLYIVFSREYVDPFFEVAIFILTGGFSFFVIAFFISELAFVKALVDNLAVRAFALVVFLCLLWVSKVSTSQMLNSAYAVSSYNFPYAMSAGVFIKTFGFLSLPFVFLAIFFEIVMLFTPSLAGKGFRGRVRFVLFVGSAFLMLYFSSLSASYVGLSNKTKFFIVRMAYDFDFVSKFRCELTNSDEYKVAYVGDSQNRAIYVKKLPNITKSVRSLSASELEKYMPSVQNTRLVNCN
ncbi:hypothetical protein [Chitinibacter sp. S2-10]|uniref:hypothetical protein n=1 Tax=Chitinibacter sp. S2-10 TaxID=3373597 RepID=UPI00397776CC